MSVRGREGQPLNDFMSFIGVKDFVMTLVITSATKDRDRQQMTKYVVLFMYGTAITLLKLILNGFLESKNTRKQVKRVSVWVIANSNDVTKIGKFFRLGGF